MYYRNGLKILFLFFLPLQLTAQDVTGLWKGFMYNDTTQQNYRYEIAISEEKGKLYGYSHQYFIIGDKEYHGVKKLKIKRDGNEITTEEVDLIVHNYPIAPAKGVWQFNNLVLTIKGDVMVLSGGYKTNRTRTYRPLTGYVHVERNYDYTQSALVPHLQELNLVKNLTFLAEALQKENDFVLKPITSDEEIKAIVIAAQKQEPATQIKTSATPDVTLPQVAAIKQPEVKKETATVKENNPPPIAAVAKETKQVNDLPKAETAKVPSPEATKKAIVNTPPIANATTPAVVKPATPKPQPAVIAAVTLNPTKQPGTVNQAPKTTPPQPTVAVVKPAEQPVVKTGVPAPIPKPVAPKPQPVIVDPTAATDLANRKVETIKALYFKSDSLILTLYDNGEVDGDTVSVIMNGNIIMPRVGLSTNAYKKTIYTNDIAGDSIQLVMYAESLGSLPPNTGLLIVNDGNDRYEIRFSGDMQKSSAIVFRRRR